MRLSTLPVNEVQLESPDHPVTFHCHTKSNIALKGRDYENGFSVSLMSKDLRLVAAARAAAQASMPSLESVQAVYQSMEERGWASKDFSIVYRHVGGGCASRVDES